MCWTFLCEIQIFLLLKVIHINEFSSTSFFKKSFLEITIDEAYIFEDLDAG